MQLAVKHSGRTPSLIVKRFSDQPRWLRASASLLALALIALFWQGF